MYKQDYCKRNFYIRRYMTEILSIRLKTLYNQSINQSRVTHICIYAKSASQNIRVISYQRIKSSNIFIHLRLSVNYDSVSIQTTVWTIP